MNEFGYFPPVEGLLHLGEAKGFDDSQWPDYVALGFAAEHVSELARMATDARFDELDSERPEVWAPLHAMRALGQLRAAATAEQLLRYIGSRPADDIDDWTMDELPTVLSMFGESIIPQLVEHLQRREMDGYIRHLGARALKELAQRSPDTRPRCIAAIAEQLETFADDDPTLNGFLVADLVELEAVETLPLIERAYLAGAVDESIIGDYDDVQVALGVKARRETPRPRYQQWAFGRDNLSWGMTADERRDQANQRKKQRKAEAKAKARRKQKAKQSQQSRRRR